MYKVSTKLRTLGDLVWSLGGEGFRALGPGAWGLRDGPYFLGSGLPGSGFTPSFDSGPPTPKHPVSSKPQALNPKAQQLGPESKKPS